MRLGCLLSLSLLGVLGCSQPGETDIARGNVLASRGALAEAASAYLAASRAAPNRARPSELLGHVLFDQGRFQESRLAYEEALRRSDTSLEARIGLARLDAEEGKLDAAIERLSQLLAQQPDNLFARLSRANLAIKRATPQDLETAIQDTAFAMQIDARNPSVLYGRGQAFLASKQLEEASASFELLAQAHPQSALGPYAQARLAAVRGDKAKAILSLKEARSRSSGTWKPDEVLRDPLFAPLKDDPEFLAAIQVP
jgi:tetratricopeptide (TPR) repeat protein